MRRFQKTAHVFMTKIIKNYKRNSNHRRIEKSLNFRNRNYIEIDGNKMTECS